MLDSGMLFQQDGATGVGKVNTPVVKVDLCMHLGDVRRITRHASIARDEDTSSDVVHRDR